MGRFGPSRYRSVERFGLVKVESGQGGSGQDDSGHVGSGQVGSGRAGISRPDSKSVHKLGNTIRGFH